MRSHYYSIDVDRLLLIIVLLIVNPSLDFDAVDVSFCDFLSTCAKLKVALNSYGICIVKTN